MTITIGACPKCDGTGRTVQGITHFQITPEGVPAVAKRGKGTTPVGEPRVVTCWTCRGLKAADGKTYARYRDSYTSFGEPYKNASTLKAAITRGKAVVCKECAGVGQMREFDSEIDCYDCNGRGETVTAFEPGDVMPGWLKLDRHPTGEGLAAYAANVTVQVEFYGDGVLTTGASLLGLGTVYSVTDYGRALEERDEAGLTARVRESLGKHTQWTKFVSEGRVVADIVRVVVTRNGYAVVTEASAESTKRVMLPPTYTADVLNAPYNG